jgi:hypothetical protein
VKRVFPSSLVLNANTSDCIHDSDGRCVYISSDNEQWLRLLSAMYNLAEVELLRAAGVHFNTTVVSFVGGLSWQSLLAELDSVVGLLELPLTRELLSSSTNVYMTHPSPLLPTQSRHRRVSSLCYQQWRAAAPAAASLTAADFSAAMRRKGHTCSLTDAAGDAAWPGISPDAASMQAALEKFYNAASSAVPLTSSELKCSLTAPVTPATLYAADAAAPAARSDALEQMLQDIDCPLHTLAAPALGSSGALLLDSWAPTDDVSHAHRRAPVGKTKPVMSLSGAVTATLAGFMSTFAFSSKVFNTRSMIVPLQFLQCKCCALSDYQQQHQLRNQ